MDKAFPFIQDRDFAIRLMRDDKRDYRLMSEWLTDERVLEFYEGRDNPHDSAKAREKFRPLVTGEDSATPCILEHGDAPIGYIQYYPVEDVAEYGLESGDDTYGLDLFIGEPEYWNRGIGSRAMRALITYLFESTDARRIVIDPQVSNCRAIRSYEKAGFSKFKVLPKHEWHEGEYRDCWIMVIDRE